MKMFHSAVLILGVEHAAVLKVAGHSHRATHDVRFRECAAATERSRCNSLGEIGERP